MVHVCLYCVVLAVPSSLEITCWERADLLVLLCVMFLFVFVIFPYGVLGQVWSLIRKIVSLISENGQKCVPLLVLYSFSSSICLFESVSDYRNYLI